jgi:DNA-binding response OmpR family regulator
MERRRILYVEDHDDTCELVRFFLDQRGYEVATAQTFAGALKLAQNQKFDLYILDSWLPDGSGVDLCRRIRDFDSHTPILFYSAAAYHLDKETALASGAQDYLTKPAGLTELGEVISNLINSRRGLKRS